jgi:ketosteroid isomerase-like protein
MSASNVAVVRGVLDSFNRRDASVGAARLHPQIEWDTRGTPTPGDQDVFYGREGVARFLGGWTETFKNLSFEPEEFVDLGDDVLVAVRTSGRARSSELPIEMRQWFIYTLSSGLVVRFQAFTDREAALNALGLAEWPGRAGS